MTLQLYSYVVTKTPCLHCSKKGLALGHFSHTLIFNGVTLSKDSTATLMDTSVPPLVCPQDSSLYPHKSFYKVYILCIIYRGSQLHAQALPHVDLFASPTCIHQSDTYCPTECMSYCALFVFVFATFTLSCIFLDSCLLSSDLSMSHFFLANLCHRTLSCTSSFHDRVSLSTSLSGMQISSCWPLSFYQIKQTHPGVSNVAATAS